MLLKNYNSLSSKYKRFREKDRDLMKTASAVVGIVQNCQSKKNRRFLH